MIKFSRSLLVITLIVCCFQPHSSAQFVDADFDFLVVPIARSAEAPEYDFSAPSMLERGFSLLPVTLPTGSTLPLGEVNTFEDELKITLDAGEAVRLWSAPIPLDATAVHFTAQVDVEGPNLQQSGLAIINADDPVDLAATIALSKEIPKDGNTYSFEMLEEINNGILLVQFVGPMNGQSTVTLRQMRLMKNATSIDYALTNTAISRNIHFGSIEDFIITNTPPSTDGVTAEIITNDTHSAIPETDQDFALKLSTQKIDDIIQVSIPIELKQKLTSETSLIYVQAYVKRTSGTQGVFSLALFNSETSSGGYREYPLSSLPLDQWVKVETPVRILPENVNSPLLILQYREGVASILIDDISLHKIQNSYTHWDQEVLQLYKTDGKK